MPSKLHNGVDNLGLGKSDESKDNDEPSDDNLVNRSVISPQWPVLSVKKKKAGEGKGGEEKRDKGKEMDVKGSWRRGWMPMKIWRKNIGLCG
ncbi:hypothetical protein FRC09_007037 [Ceratobasidium sp. 395]|nr:hypothetical protein FRC09_007037 [Ceratobasidium sp. 395]